MRKLGSVLAIGGVIAVAFGFAVSTRAADAKAKEFAEAEEKAEAKAETKSGAKEMQEFLVFDKAKLGAVKFPHKQHADAFLGKCDTCHGGKAPIFAQEKSEGLKMADMYAGKSCGSCHDGKMKHGDKVIFAAKGGCMKCHKKG